MRDVCIFDKTEYYKRLTIKCMHVCFFFTKDIQFLAPEARVYKFKDSYDYSHPLLFYDLIFIKHLMTKGAVNSQRRLRLGFRSQNEAKLQTETLSDMSI